MGTIVSQRSQPSSGNNQSLWKPKKKTAGQNSPDEGYSPSTTAGSLSLLTSRALSKDVCSGRLHRSKKPWDALTAGRLAPSQGPGEQAGGLPVAHVPETLPRISILRLPLSAVRASLVHVGSLCCPCRVTVPLRRASTLLPYRGSCLLVGVPTLRAGWYDTDTV